jgi:perosamine synthetase
MSIFREIPPTAGYPLYGKDIISLLKARDSLGSLEHDFKEYLKVGYARLTSSGTCALYLLLESLKKISGRKAVVIPSFICPLVPLAIARAGLKVHVCDVNRDNFNFDRDQLEELCDTRGDILAIVAVHLAGLPLDFGAVAAVAEKKDIFVIEDCAQSLGALYQGKKVGTLGDFSFFSLSRGKGLTLYEGGVMVSNREGFGELIDATIKEQVKGAPFSESALMAKLLGYWIFYRPSLFWYVFRLPQIFWKWRGDRIRAAMERFSPDFPVHGVSGARQSIGHAAFHRLEEEILKQRQKVSFYRERLKEIKGIKMIEEDVGSRATYPFVTVLFEDKERRERVLNTLEKSGLGGSFIYALAVTDYDYLQGVVSDGNCSNGRSLADRTVTLSTSTFLKEGDLNALIGLLRNT